MENVSVIIPTLNPLKEELESSIKILRMSEKNPKIVFIDSSSNDKSFYSIADKVITIEKAEFNHGATRNMAAMSEIEGGAEILVFMTQDVVMKDKNALSLLIEPIIGRLACATYGRQLPKYGATVSERYARYHQYKSETIYRSLSGETNIDVNMFRFSNVFSAVRSREFVKIGGFSSSTILNEDMLLAATLLRNNENIAYVGSAEVFHSHNYDLKQQLRRNFDIGVSIKEASILLQGASIGKEGVKFAIGQINYAIRNEELLAVPYIIFELAMRWIGLQLGKRYIYIPLMLRKKLSMHSYHWDQKQNRLEEQI